jgi:aspartate/methionine/tyrosine aminotransferase
MVAFPTLLSGDVDRFCELLRGKYEATVVPGRFLEMAGHFRVGIATENLVEGLERMGSALDEFGGAGE